MASVVLAGSPATGCEAARPAEHGEYGSGDDTVQLQLARLHGSPRLSCCLGCLLSGVQQGFIPGFESSDREGDECLSGRPALHSWIAVVHNLCSCDESGWSTPATVQLPSPGERLEERGQSNALELGCELTPKPRRGQRSTICTVQP